MCIFLALTLTVNIDNQGYGGLDGSELKRVKELEKENRKLKRMYAELALDLEAAKEGVSYGYRPGHFTSVQTFYSAGLKNPVEFLCILVANFKCPHLPAWALLDAK